MSVAPPETGLVAPLPFPVRSMLRAATVDHLRSERRALFPATIHVGTPGAFRVSTPVADIAAEFATTADTIHAMVRCAERTGVSTPSGIPWVWLTRSGEAGADALDFTLLAPTMHAYAEAGQPLTFFVVTRRSWHDPRSGLQRSWTRLRTS